MALFTGGANQDANDSTITYRHILSAQAMSVFNPLRTIAHCDIDGAFAQFEQVRLGLPDDAPLLCSQWDTIIAVNYPAKAFGIKRMTSITEAKKLCPHVVVQHVATYKDGDSEAGYWDEVDRRTHKVSLDPYRRESLKVLAVFREMVPRGELEKASIDEAFMDLTPMVLEKLQEVFPYLRSVPDDAPDGLDSPLPPPPPIDWANAGHVVPVARDDAEEGAETDDAEATTWADWALCIGAEIMAAVRAEVWKRLHYTCSAGIAKNKALSKLCSGWKKPNQQTVLRVAATPGFLRDMDFTEIRNLGGKLGHAMAEEFGVKTVGDLLTVSLEDMQAKFGEESIWVYNIIRGIDHTEVKEKLATKSMLASKNTNPNVRTQEQGHHWLAVLAGELAVRLREARGATPGLWPKTLVLGTRSGYEASRTRQTPFPFHKDVNTAYIVKHARKLWDEHVGHLKPGAMKLNNISLSFTGLEKLEEGQQGIEGFFAGAASKRPRAAQSNGTPAPETKRARLPTLHTGSKPKTQLQAFFDHAKEAAGSTPASALASNAERTSSSPSVKDKHETVDAVESEPKAECKATPKAESKEQAEFKAEPKAESETDPRVCTRCGERLPSPEDRDDDWVERARREHEDWHFAMDLQAEYGAGTSGADDGGGTQPRAPTKPKGPKSRKAEGIKAFFAPKK